MLCLYTIHIHILYTIHKNITKYLSSICDKYQDINLLIVKIFIQLGIFNLINKLIHKKCHKHSQQQTEKIITTEIEKNKTTQE